MRKWFGNDRRRGLPWLFHLARLLVNAYNPIIIHVLRRCACLVAFLVVCLI